jgi:hypothetical protein
MDIFMTGRGGGKTTFLIQRMLEDPEHSVMICSSARDASRLAHEYADQGLTPDNFVAFGRQGFSDARRVRGKTRVYADNVDQILLGLFGGHIDIITMTNGDLP